MRLTLLSLPAMILCACPSAPPHPAVDAGPMPRFVSDAPADAGMVWLAADVSDPAEVTLTVWSAARPTVFGFAFHLGFDPGALQLVDGGLEPALGEGAVTLYAPKAGDVAIGATRL